MIFVTNAHYMQQDTLFHERNFPSLAVWVWGTSKRANALCFFFTWTSTNCNRDNTVVNPWALTWASWDFETGKECQKLMLDTMSRPIFCIWSYKALSLSWSLCQRWYWNFSNFKAYELLEPLAIFKGIQINFSTRLILCLLILPLFSIGVHPTFQELSVKVEKRPVYG